MSDIVAKSYANRADYVTDLKTKFLAHSMMAVYDDQTASGYVVYKCTGTDEADCYLKLDWTTSNYIYFTTILVNCNNKIKHEK